MKIPGRADVKTNKAKKDLHQTIYRARVYDLNVESGNCWSYYYPNDDSEFHYKVPIRITKGDKTYENSKYSKSLHSKEVINISGIGEWVGDKLIAIHVTL